MFSFIGVSSRSGPETRRAGSTAISGSIHSYHLVHPSRIERNASLESIEGVPTDEHRTTGSMPSVFTFLGFRPRRKRSQVQVDDHQSRTSVSTNSKYGLDGTSARMSAQEMFHLENPNLWTSLSDSEWQLQWKWRTDNPKDKAELVWQVLRDLPDDVWGVPYGSVPTQAILIHPLLSRHIILAHRINYQAKEDEPEPEVVIDVILYGKTDHSSENIQELSKLWSTPALKFSDLRDLDTAGMN
ncbi:hypothetical protein QFC22_006471 [Naganishia vaughanmartiniae]|uniref:Uncharacterized protein n=1 Tax=Naganishia vaughanmartiniae TaxID=1424756 RepID=A0ACC2WK94_9TREE|nr:hypothetical protein QFC22_006471 [Naganishia vaughanmartiniae]